MKIKTSIILATTISLLTLFAIYANAIPPVIVQGSKTFLKVEIPVVIKPMKAGNEVVPVEIQCEPVFITGTDTLDDFYCILINKTDKSIRASSVRYSIIFESNGKEEQENRLDTADTYLHPDLSEEKKPVGPGGQLSVRPPGSIFIRDSVIKRLELEPVYLEFADGTTLGIGGQGAELIANLREGAARYKKSLRQIYLNKEKSAQAILPLLEDDASLGSEIENFGQRTGAKAYRRFLRKKYKEEGIKAINNVLQ